MNERNAKNEDESGCKEEIFSDRNRKDQRKHAFKSHILTKKSTKRKRNLTYAGEVNKTDLKNVKLLLAMK